MEGHLNVMQIFTSDAKKQHRIGWVHSWILALEEGARESLPKEWTTQMRSEVVRTVFQRVEHVQVPTDRKSVV